MPSVHDCDFETLLALADQMPRERFEQLRRERPDFDRWLSQRLAQPPSAPSKPKAKRGKRRRASSRSSAAPA